MFLRRVFSVIIRVRRAGVFARLAVLLCLAVATVVGAGVAGRSAARAASQSSAATGVRPAVVTLDRLPGMPATGELVWRRTATSRSFRLADGRVETFVYTSPVDYRVGGGWRPIDDSIVASRRRGFAWVNAANDYRVYLPKRLNGSAVVVHSRGGWVSLRLVGASAVVGRVAGDSVTYSGVLPGVALTFMASPAGVNESLAVDPAGAASGPVRFLVAHSSGLDVRSAGPGALQVSGASGVGFVLSPFTARGVGAREEPPVVAPVRYDPATGIAAVTPSGPASTPGLPSRPWVLDGLISPSPADTQDCYITSSNPDQSFCAGSVGAKIRVGWDGSYRRRGLLDFDLSGVPGGNPGIESATLNLYCEAATTTQFLDLEVHRVSSTWTNSATWNTRDGTNAWGAAGGEYRSTDFADRSTNCSDIGWKVFGSSSSGTLGQLVQDWVSGTYPNDGLELLAVPDSGASAAQNLVDFVSNEDTSGKAPYLTVTTYNPPSTPTVGGGSDSSWSAVPVTLTASATAASGRTVEHFWYETSSDGHAWTSPVEVAPTTTNGATATYALTLSDQGTTYVQFQAEDDLNDLSAWSVYGSSSTAMVDTDVPDAPTSVTGGSSSWQVGAVTISAGGGGDSGPSGYSYQYETSPDGSSWSSPSQGSSETVTDPGLTYVRFQTITGAGLTSTGWTPTNPTPDSTAVVDAVSPTSPAVSGGSDAWSNAAFVLITASGSTDTGGPGIDHYEYRTSADGGASWSSLSKLSSGTTSVQEMQEGTTLVQMRAVDSVGVASAWAPAPTDAADTVMLDRTAPTPPSVSGGSDAWQDASSVVITGAGSSDALSGVDHYEYRTSVDGGATWSAAATGSSVTITADGETDVQFAAVDAAGNPSAWSPASPTPASTVRLDTGAPQITSSTDPDQAVGYTGSEFQASWTAPADMPTATGYAVVVDQSATTIPDPFVTQTAASIDLTDQQPGGYYLHVRATDGMGDWSPTATFQYTIFDVVSPAAGDATNSTETLQAPVPAGATDVSFQFRTDDSQPWSDVPSTRVTDEAGDQVVFPLQPAAGTGETTPVTWDVADTSSNDPGVGTNGLSSYDGIVEVRAVMTAADGTQIATDPNLFTLNRVPPAPLDMSIPAAANGAYVTGQPVTVSWDTNGQTDIAGYSIVVDQTASTDAPTTVNASASSTSTQVSSASPAVLFLHIRSVDTSGNWSATQTERLQFQSAIVSAPQSGASADGATPLDLQMTSASAAYVCWQYSAPGMSGWATIPPADVTVSGSVITGWPYQVAGGSATDWQWGAYATEPGIDNWPGEFAVRAVTVPTATTACSDASATQVAAMPVYYDPTSGSNGALARPASSGGVAPLRDALIADGGGGVGGAILYSEFNSQGNEHFTVQSDGTDNAPVGGLYTTGYPVSGASNDGTVVAYTSQAPSGSCQDAISVQTPTGVVTHQTDQPVYFIAVSPDGTQIIYLTRSCSEPATWTIWWTQVANWSPQAVNTLPDTSGDLASPSFTPDGTEIMYDQSVTDTPTCADCRDLDVEPVPGGSGETGTILTAGSCWWDCVSGLGHTFEWDQQGSQLAVQTGPDTIAIYPTPNGVSGLLADGGDPTPSDTLDSTTYPALPALDPANTGAGVALGPWSPDGSNILVDDDPDDPAGDQSIVAINPTSHTQHTIYHIADPNTYWIVPYAWTTLPVDQNVLASEYRPHLMFDSTEKWTPINPDALLQETWAGNPVSRLCDWYQSPPITDTGNDVRGDPASPTTKITYKYQPVCPPNATSGGTDHPNDNGFVTQWAADATEMSQTPSVFDPYAPPGYTNTHDSPQLEINGTGSASGLDYHGLGIDCSASGVECDTNGSGPIYYHIVTDAAGWTYIEYWIFYRFNDASGSSFLYNYVCFSGSPAPCDDQHQGDWEAVTVAIDPNDHIRWVAYSQHRHWYQYTTADILAHQADGAGFTGGTHPNVYVASGTHANYPDACSAFCVNWDIGGIGPTFGGEASHDGATSWTFNQDSLCAESCVAPFDTTDFQQANLPLGWFWGLNPPLGFGDGSVALTQAAGGPDSSGHSAEFTNPSQGLVDGTGHWGEAAIDSPTFWLPPWL